MNLSIITIVNATKGIKEMPPKDIFTASAIPQMAPIDEATVEKAVEITKAMLEPWKQMNEVILRSSVESAVQMVSFALTMMQQFQSYGSVVQSTAEQVQKQFKV